MIKQYIENMEIFFKFGENILSNYDVEYPSFYQQLNLKTFLGYLKEDVSLKEFDEPPQKEDDDDESVINAKDGASTWVELIFDYSYNNFIFNKKYKKLKLKYFKDNFDNKILNTIAIDDERIIIAFKESLKVYDFKNKNVISTLNNLYSPGSKFILSPIIKDLFAVISYISDDQSILKILSISSGDKILFEKSYKNIIKDIKKINNNSFGIILDDDIEIYKLSESTQENSDTSPLNANYNPNFEMITTIKVVDVKDFVVMSFKPYLVALSRDGVRVFDQNYDILKEIDIYGYVSINEFK